MMAAVVPVSGAAADRDIVYSARYYNPPKNKSVSHFHLYRINPDGSGRIQLTRDSADDRDPKWSRDGNYILFLRTFAKGNAYCLFDVKRNRVRTLHRFSGYGQERSEDCDAHWFGGSSSVFLERYRFNSHGDAQPIGKWLIDAKRGRRMKLPVAKTPEAGNPKPPVTDVKWLDQERSAGTIMGENDSELCIVNPLGKITWKKSFSALRGGAAKDDGLINWIVAGGIKGMKDSLLCKLNVGHAPEGTRRVWEWNLVDLKSATMKTLLEGMSVGWEPGGKRFAAVPTTSLSGYDSKRQVFTAPLQIRSWTDGQTRPIVSGTVWVWSVDWR